MTTGDTLSPGNKKQPLAVKQPTHPPTQEGALNGTTAPPPVVGVVAGAEEPMDTSDVENPTSMLNTGDDAMVSTSLDDDDAYKPEVTIRFEVKNFTEFARGHEQRLSPSANVRGLPWKVLAMPRESGQRPERRVKALGFFLQCNADSQSTTWTCNAHAILKILSQKEGVKDSEKKISHTFHSKENDWGYSQFMTFEQLLDVENGFLKDDTIILEVYVNADAPHGVQWDSKKHTGCIGLKNQGATCYMNSLLQTLFFTNKLRKAVYQMPTEKDDPTKSVALAMQRVFYELQFSDKPVGTKKLTRSFGWDTFESFLQHDVQELCRVLLDNLEDKMKGTVVEGAISKLFEGKMKMYIRCTGVSFESSRTEPFYDIQLNIKGKENIAESFKDYITKETLDGDNKYDAGEYGLQPAEKGVIFLKYPPVLHLQLMRFQYDPIQDANVKVNDRFEFPEKLDLSDYLDKTEGDTAAAQVYILHAVLVHSGDILSGHYVVFINPKGSGRWCKFDDDVVSRATTKEAVQANFGGEDPELPQRPFTNAYMLVYVRQSMLQTILEPVQPTDIPRHLRERFEQEKQQDDLRKKEKSEAHLFTTVNVIGEEVFTSHRGFDLIDHELAEKTARKFKVKKSATIAELYQQIGESYSLKPMSQFRLWHFRDVFEKKQRPNVSLLDPEQAQQQMQKQPPYRNPPPNRKVQVEDYLTDEKSVVFIEIYDFANGEKELPKFNDKLDVLIFLKYYDARHSSMGYAGHMVVSIDSRLRSMMPEMCRRARLNERDDLIIFEEAGPGKVYELRNVDRALNEDGVLKEMNDGAIIVYQLPPPSTAMLPTAVEYFQDLYNRVEIEAIEKDSMVNSGSAAGAAGSAPSGGGGGGAQTVAKKKSVTGQVSLLWTVEQFLQWLGKQIDFDWCKIQLHKPSPYGDRCGPPLSHGTVKTFKDVMSHCNSGSFRYDPRKDEVYVVYYAKMPIRIEEMEKRRQMKVQWMDSKFKVEDFVIYPDKTGTVKTIVEEIRKLVQLSPDGTGQLRLVWAGGSGTSGGAQSHRVYQVLAAELSVEAAANKAGGGVLRAEEVPTDQLNINTGSEHLLPVAHFHKDPSHQFGVPFFITVSQGEPFSRVKDRIKKLLEIPEKEFDKFKFALVVHNKAKYLEDLDNCTVNLQELGQCLPSGSQQQPWLGLDHQNKNRSARGHPIEKAIVIHN